MTHIKKTARLALCLLLMVAIFAGCAGQPAPSNDLTRVRVVLDWTPNTNHTGMYVALEKGWYAELGLYVELLQPPELGALALVGAGNAEIAVTFQEEMGPAIAAANPIPITAIATIIQHNTSGILSLAQSGIISPRDLEGRVFAGWGTDLVDETIRHIVEADGGNFDEVIVIFDAATDAISALQTRIDAIWIYYGWDGIAARLAGLDYNYIALADVDPVFDFYSPVLVANNTWLRENPDLARAFLEATARGYRFAVENPDEAADILLRHVPELGKELVRASQHFLAGQFIAGAPRWGQIDPQRWARFYDWMYERGLLARELGAEGFTNEFLLSP